jgi:hypothetical protein
VFKNYLKIAWRNLINSKVYSSLNILGLATGMAVALIIGLWVCYQHSYDRFLPNYGELYQVRYRTHYNGVVDQTPATALPLAEAIKSDIPGIKHVVHTDFTFKHGLAVGDKKLYSIFASSGQCQFGFERSILYRSYPINCPEIVWY